MTRILLVVAMMVSLCSGPAFAQTPLGDDSSNGTAGPTDLKPATTYFMASASVTVASISVYIGAYSGGTVNATMALFSAALEPPLPSAIMARCTTSVAVNSTGWKTCALTCETTCAIVNGSGYFLAWWLDSANASTTYDAGSTNQTYYTDAGLTFPTWPSDFAETAGQDRQYAIYASQAGGSSSRRRLLFGVP